MTRRPPIPPRLAIPVRVLAWILLIPVAIPTAYNAFFALAYWWPSSEPSNNPHNYMAVFSILGLAVFAPPFLALVLIVIGLHLNLRAAYVAMIVCGAIGALIAAAVTADLLTSNDFLAVLSVPGMVWTELNVAAVVLAFRALRCTRTQQQLPPTPVPMGPPIYPGGYWGR